ncbi:hypothetical protein [Massilia pseudoviolaceinigra]|nr:hypothetical protein [Massilia sp. CCM 9206]MDQ1925081.1 hypothetical protein [Massilia sp. CCM 9206]
MLSTTDIDAGPLILEKHRIGGPPWSPMQMVSAELLAIKAATPVEPG